MEEHRHILVVDDDERVLFILDRTLATLSNEHKIATAQNGQEALEKVKQTLFDVVITDLVMPGMDGVALTEAIGAQSPDTIVIWVTAHGCHRFNSEAARLSVYQCLEKPLRVADIREAVRKALAQSDLDRQRNFDAVKRLQLHSELAVD